MHVCHTLQDQIVWDWQIPDRLCCLYKLQSDQAETDRHITLPHKDLYYIIKVISQIGIVQN